MEKEFLNQLINQSDGDAADDMSDFNEEEKDGEEKDGEEKDGEEKDVDEKEEMEYDDETSVEEE